MRLFPDRSLAPMLFFSKVPTVVTGEDDIGPRFRLFLMVSRTYQSADPQSNRCMIGPYRRIPLLILHDVLVIAKSLMKGFMRVGASKTPRILAYLPNHRHRLVLPGVGY